MINNNSVISSIDHVNNKSNPHDITKEQLGLLDVLNLKHKLDGTTVPTPDDDISSGYSVGSRWIDIINEKEYVCANNISSASVWIETTTQGQVNTASNVRTIGVGIYKQKNVYDFEFKTINAGSPKLSIVDDILNDKLDIDIIESNIDINNLNGAPTGVVIGTTDVETLTNKILLDDSTYFQNNIDNSKKMRLQLSGITTNTTRTLSVPDADTIIVGHDAHQTLTNKIIDADNNTISNIDNNVIKANASIDATKIADGSIGNIEFQYLGGITSGVVAINDTQTITNKTFTDNLNYFENNADVTKKMQLDLSNITTNTTRTLSVPDAYTTFLGTDATQTIFNKTFGDNLNMGNNRIINVSAPINSSDVANKDYVDNVASGLDVKEAVKLATTVDLNSNSSIDGTITYNNTGGISGRGQITATLLTINTFIVDGVTLTSSDDGSRVLIKNQTNGDENGIWITTISGTLLTLDRATDFDEDIEVSNGSYVFIEEGTTLMNTGFVLSTYNPITIGGTSGTALTFSQFTGARQVIAGKGLTNEGNTINVGGSSTIISNADSLEVNSSNIANQVLLSSGTIGTASTFGSLPLGNTNSISGLLPINNGGTNVASFSSGNRLIATNIGNTALEASNIDPTLVVLTNSTQTLTNKNFTDNTTYFQDNADNTKKLQRSLSNITSATTRTLTVPNANTTIVGNDTTQTLTNKTIDATNNSIINIDNTNIKNSAYIDATKIADGSITNSEFQYLSGITSDVVSINNIQTITNKTFTTNNTYFQDNSDNTKKVQFQLSSITTGNVRILTIPDANTTLIGTDTTQTLTNKIIDATSNTINNIGNSQIKSAAGIDVTKIADGSVTNTEFQYLSNVSSNVVGIDDTLTLTNKTFTDNSTYFQDNLDNTKKIQFQLDNIATSTTRTFIFPDANTTIVGTDAIQTITNKLIDFDNNTVSNIDNNNIKINASIDATKIADGSVNSTEFQYLSGITSNVVSVNNIQTLTNKTFTSPRIQTAINDINGNELINFISNIGVVNEITVENKITNNSPSISATGNDNNINLDINAKGNGNVIISSLKFPNSDGLADQVLKTDGAGNLSFTNVSIENINTTTTTNNIATTICTNTTTNDTVYLMEISIVGIRTDASNEGAGFILRSVFRNDGGTLTKISEDKMYGKDSAWDVSSGISGTNIIITVTGETSKTINWKAKHKLLSI